MEEAAHPIPQNITSFEFHLVGDMTLKQFIYLASGLATAYLLFVFVAQSYPYLAWPLITISSLLGVAFAFLPISERPLDHWVSAFFKAVFRPTQRSLQTKDGLPNQRLTSFLSNQAPSGPSLEINTKPNLSAISQLSPATQPIVSPPAPSSTPLPSSDELEKTVSLAKKAQEVQTKIVATEKELGQIKTEAATPGEDPQKYTAEFQKVLSNLQDLTEQARDVSSQLAQVNKKVTAPLAPVMQIIDASTKQIPTSLVLTTIPNIINGIVTDSANNYLEGAIVVTHDKQGLPVRALKTNKLGQFVAATPLPNGEYTITFEKENFLFDTIKLTLNGSVQPPVVVAAKTGQNG